MFKTPQIITCILLAIIAFFIAFHKSNNQAIHTQTIHRYTVAKKIWFTNFGDISGITYNPNTKNYWLVNNSPPLIFEMDQNGQELRRISLKGIKDIEDICWIKDNLFAVVEETKNRLIIFRIDENCKNLSSSEALNTWQAPYKFLQNNGLESIAYNSVTESFICLSEKNPIICYEVKFQKNKLIGQEILADKHINDIIKDVSAAAFIDGQIVLLSDESNLLLYLRDNKTFDIISLDSGYNGLEKRVSQAEGLCFVDDQIIVASEPNHVYFFKKIKK